jgi:hypothetical protein
MPLNLKWRQSVPPKYWYPCTRLYGAITHRSTMYISLSAFCTCLPVLCVRECYWMPHFQTARWRHNALVLAKKCIRWAHKAKKESSCDMWYISGMFRVTLALTMRAFEFRTLFRHQFKASSSSFSGSCLQSGCNCHYNYYEGVNSQCNMNRFPCLSLSWETRIMLLSEAQVDLNISGSFSSYLAGNTLLLHYVVQSV